MKANKSQSSLSKSFEASASNRVIHWETFTIPSYQVKKAETLLEVHSILTHTTQRTIEKYVKLTKVLFPDSKIPEQLELGRTKLGYLLQFGLAPYYKEQLFSSLLPVTGFAPKFVSCFDEAFSHIWNQTQMDVHVFSFMRGNKYLDLVSDHIFWVMLMQKRYFSQYKQFIRNLIWLKIWGKFQWMVQMWVEKK